MSAFTAPLDPSIIQRLAPLLGAPQPGTAPGQLQRLPAPDTSAYPLMPPPIAAQSPLTSGTAPTPDVSGMTLQKIPTTLDAVNGQLPTLPKLSATPANPQLTQDISKLDYLRNSGSGISQIGNDVDAQGNKTSNHPGFWKTLGKIGATVGDTALQLAAPGLERLIPGTQGNNLRLQGLQQGYVDKDLASAEGQAKLAQDQAQLGLTGAQTDYFAARPDIEQSKIDQKQTAIEQRVTQAAAARGQNTIWDPVTHLPTFTDDHESQEFKDHQALSAMHQATADKSAIMSDIAKNHYIPGTPEFQEAQKKLSQVDQRLQVAIGSLGLRAQGIQLRKEGQQASLYGTDLAGNALPGAAQITDDNGGVQTVGQKNAGRAIGQQKTVATFNDLQGSVSHLRNALQAYEAEGGDMSDARLAQAASDPTSVVGKVMNGKLVTGGLSPAALTLLNAQRQTMEQAGILRSTTGGTASEAGAQRIMAVVPQFGTDTNESAMSKLDEQEGVLARLRPGLTPVAGGLSVHQGGKQQSGETIPAAAAAQLQEGVVHTFGNGQQWTKRNGTPVRVK